MRRAIALLLMIIASFSLFAEPIQYKYEPYEEEEFPIWSMELRRAETVFFGSFVITLPLTMAAYGIASSLGAPITQNEFQRFGEQALIASGLSLGIALTDYLIGAFSD